MLKIRNFSAADSMARLTVEPRIVTHARPACVISRRAQARRTRTYQRQVLGVTAFKSQDETISISFDGYNLLQVNRAASRETCSKKYDEMINSPPDCGYSQETLYSRAVVLKSATEAVMDLTATPSYRQQPGQLAVELLYSDLPGALALLQEAGESQTVLDWGGAWLRDNATDSKTKDVALALALVHCDHAAMRMEQDTNDTMAAAEEMTVALRLLRQHAAGEQLQQEITGALQELEPKVALQQIALPVDDVQRAVGLALLTQLVWKADKSKLGMERADYMRTVRDNLTAAEQIVLYEGAGEHVKLSSEDQYDTALAYLAEGYCSRRPQHVRTAHRLLAPLQKQTQAGAGTAEIDVSVELAVCCLLLGDSEKAEDVLGLIPGSSVQQADPAVRSFVLDACPGPDDLLPGLCALTEKWLADVALPGFRGSPSQTGTLTDWFQDRRISLYLQVLDNGRRLHLGDAAHATKSALSRFSNSVTAALRTPLTAIQNALGGPTAAASSAADPPQSASTAAISGDAQDQALRQDSRSADYAHGQGLRQESRSADSAQSQLPRQDSHSAGVSNVAQDQLMRQDSYSAGDSDGAQGADVRGDLHSVEASPPQADALPAVLPAGAKIRVSMRAPSNADMGASPMEERLADALLAGTDLATKQQPNPASNDLLDEDMGPLRRAPPSRAGLSRASLQGSVAITDGIVQFAGEREMWASFQDANMRKQKQLKALIAGAAVLVAALAFRTFQQHRSTTANAAMTTSPHQPVSHVVHQAGALTETSAKQLLLQWQNVKADALGAKHSSHKLSSVLDGQLLASWGSQARQVEAENKHWEYELHKLDILSVDVVDDGNSAVILAALQEDASLYEDAELVHVYKGTFTSEYTMTKQPYGWKLTSNSVTF